MTKYWGFSSWVHDAALGLVYTPSVTSQLGMSQVTYEARAQSKTANSDARLVPFLPSACVPPHKKLFASPVLRDFYIVTDIIIWSVY